MSADKKYITVTEAEAMGYGCKSRLYQLINDGVIPAYHLAPRMTRLKVDDLDRLMKPVSSSEFKAEVQNDVA